MAEYDILGNPIEGGTTEVAPEDAYEDSKKRFVELLDEFKQNALNDLVSERDGVKTQEENLIRQARETRWRLNDIKNRISVLEDAQEKRSESFAEQFDALLRHEKVQAVGINGGQLLIKTEQLDMLHEDIGETKVLGEFEISLPLTADRARDVSVKNLTNAREDNNGSVWQHPHVQNNTPCYGGYETEMMDMLSAGEFTAALEGILLYLSTINPDDEYGRNWSLWD